MYCSARIGRDSDIWGQESTIPKKFELTLFNREKADCQSIETVVVISGSLWEIHSKCRHRQFLLWDSMNRGPLLVQLVEETEDAPINELARITIF